MLDVGTIAFMDDILIHAETKKEHDLITLEVLKRLRDNRLCIAPDKCEWAVQKVEFLGYVISGDDLEMTNDKALKLLTWSRWARLRGLLAGKA